FSSNGKTRPRKRACGPSGPLNHASSSRRFFPVGFSNIPRQTSAKLSDEINNESSVCSPIHLRSASEGRGLMVLLMMLVSSKYRVTGQRSCPHRTGAQSSGRNQRAVNAAAPQGFHPFGEYRRQRV